MRKLVNPGGHYLVACLEQGIKPKKKGAPLTTSQLCPLELIVERIRTDPRIFNQTQSVRRLMRQWGNESRVYKRAKLYLPCYIPQAEAPEGTTVADMPPHLHNGLYVYDIDEEKERLDTEAVADLLQKIPSVVLVARSASGQALYSLVAGPKTADENARISFWNSIREAMPEEIRAHIAVGQDNLNRMRTMASDAGCWLATEVHPENPPEPPKAANPQKPAPPTRKPEQETEFQRRRRIRRELSGWNSKKHKFGNASSEREHIREALSAIPPSHADNYNNWISVAFALAGGEHQLGPEFGGKELFLEYSLRNGKYQPGDENTFDDAYRRWSGRTGLGRIIKVAQSYGWSPKKAGKTD